MTRRAVRVLASVVPLAAVVAAMTAAPAQAASFSGCTAHACAGVNNYRYWPTGGGWYTADISLPYLNDLKKNDGYSPTLRIVYTNPNGVQRLYIRDWDNGTITYHDDKYLLQVKNLYFEVCHLDNGHGTLTCRRMSQTSALS
ncbi:hypothetical protein [Streptomyces aureoversilis]|uniref:Secreted protein n=1 Tax=Streptomyces aureoversilis TaxID=67277 RepID=A0ABV9ZT59_9ACTN